MIGFVRGMLVTTVYDETDRPIGEVNLLLTATPGPDGWTVNVARPATPEQCETVVLPNIEATARQVLGALYSEGLVT